MGQGKREEAVSKSRFRAGVIVFLASFFSPLLIPLVALTHLPTTWKVTISGLLMAGIPEVVTLAAVAIMGKPGFNYLKAWIFGFLRKYGPPDRVSRTRYRIGLVMFVIPFLFGWLTPYVSHRIPEYEAYRIAYGVAGDMLLAVSLFVLGGDFWDKLRALFTYGLKATSADFQNTDE